MEKRNQFTVDLEMELFFGRFRKDTLETLYEGEFKNGKMHGNGIQYYEEEYKWYVGEYKDGKRHGLGIWYGCHEQCIYKGQWMDDKFNGRGILYNDDLTKSYEGDFKDGKKHGNGIEYFNDGTIKYKGKFTNVLIDDYQKEFIFDAPKIRLRHEYVLYLLPLEICCYSIIVVLFFVIFINISIIIVY